MSFMYILCFTEAVAVNQDKKSAKSSSNNSGVIILVTVIFCIAIIGAGIFVGVYIYRYVKASFCALTLSCLTL